MRSRAEELLTAWRFARYWSKYSVLSILDNVSSDIGKLQIGLNCLSLVCQLPAQPGLSESKVMADDVNRDTKRLSAFLGGHAAEVTHFNQVRQSFVFGSQIIDGRVELDDFD